MTIPAGKIIFPAWKFHNLFSARQLRFYSRRGRGWVGIVMTAHLAADGLMNGKALVLGKGGWQRTASPTRRCSNVNFNGYSNKNYGAMLKV
jgi:hypothetical protein